MNAVGDQCLRVREYPDDELAPSSKRLFSAMLASGCLARDLLLFRRRAASKATCNWSRAKSNISILPSGGRIAGQFDTIPLRISELLERDALILSSTDWPRFRKQVLARISRATKKPRIMARLFEQALARTYFWIRKLSRSWPAIHFGGLPRPDHVLPLSGSRYFGATPERLRVVFAPLQLDHQPVPGA